MPDQWFDPSLYPLSATQLAMATFVLTHDATGATHGFDTEQIHIRLKHALDVPTLRGAWNIVSRHHSILTNSIVWKDIPFLSQRANLDVQTPVRVVKLDSDSPAEFQALLQRDREQGFQLDTPPLQRVTIVTTPGGSNQLLWTVHHILVDGRSFEPILADVFSTYDQLVAGIVNPELTRRRPFREYVESIGAVQTVTANAPAGREVALVLPNVSDSEPVGFGSVVDHSEIGRRVQEFASTRDVSPSAIVATAWALTLARVGANTAVLFSLSRLGRSGLGGEAKHMVGPFTVTAPLQLELDPTMSAGEFFTTVHQRLRDLSGLEGPSLLNSTSTEAPNAVPETHFLYESTDPELEIPKSPQLAPHIEAVRIHERTTFPITLTVHSGSQFRITLSYQTPRCTDALAVRLLKSFVHNLEVLTHKPEARLSTFNGVPPADQKLLLEEWAATARYFPQDDLIHSAFLRQCQMQPDAIAIEYQGASLSYAELDTRSNQLAHQLDQLGVHPQDVVAVYLRRSSLLVVALLAVAKLGGVYVAIDPKYPSHRRHFMVDDCKAKVVLTDHTTHETTLPGAINLQSESFKQALSTSPTWAPQPGCSADGRCYIMYTSGSTGRPKGVILTHRSVINTLDWVNRTFSCRAGDKLLFVNSPSFDLSVYDIFGTLSAGGTIHISMAEASEDPASLAQTLLTGGITVWNSTPSFLQLLVQCLPSTPSETLRLILLSGDWIPIPLIAQLRELFPRAEVVSLGGATEAAIWSNYYVIGSVSKQWRSVPYGRPIQNSQYYILNDELQLVPIGTPGELFIGGECVAVGYLDRDELTAFRFPANPFGQGRLYRTGDLCRYLDDQGTIEILGRKDNQVKIRGYRVELGEVEQALLQIPDVHAAACSTSRDSSNQLSIVAFVVLKPGATFDEASIHNRLHEHLPDFMLPSRVVQLPALPISSTGKVDRAALRPPAEDVSLGSSPHSSSGSEEEQLIAIWRKLLNRRSIEPTADFFELGGHSLLAIHLIREINRTFAVEVHLGTLFQYRTPRGLAARIVQLRASQVGVEAWTSLVPIQPVGDLPPIFCVAGAGGSPVEGRPLSKALGERQPFFGVQLRLLPESTGGPTIAQIAASIKLDLLASTLKPPFYLAGFSAGGVIAQEIARQLRDEGYDVPLLILLDAFNPTLKRWTTWERMMHFTDMLQAYGLRYSLKRLQARVEHKLIPDITGRGPSDTAAIQAQTTTAINNHQPQPYAGPTLLIRTPGKPVVDVDYRTEPTNGWAPYLSNLEVITVPGRHDQLLTSQVAVVANHLQTALKARGGQVSPLRKT